MIVPPFCIRPGDVPFIGIAGTTGLKSDGTILDWCQGEVTTVNWSGGARFTRMAEDGHARLIALDANNIAYWGTPRPDINTFWSHAFEQDREIVDIASGGPSALCVLDIDGVIDCVAGGPQGGIAATFPNPPYRSIDGHYHGVCALRAVDDVLECNDGSTHDFGPLLDFAVTITYAQSIMGGVPDEVQVCVLTTSNAVRCVGRRYSPDVLARLPAGDDL